MGGGGEGWGRQSADEMPCLVHFLWEENTTLLPNGWRHLSGVIKELKRATSKPEMYQMLRRSLDFKTTRGPPFPAGRNLTRRRFKKRFSSSYPKWCVSTRFLLEDRTKGNVVDLKAGETPTEKPSQILFPGVLRLMGTSLKNKLWSRFLGSNYLIWIQ